LPAEVLQAMRFRKILIDEMCAKMNAEKLTNRLILLSNI
jgi:hypothetical protein